mgnify:FL=1
MKALKLSLTAEEQAAAKKNLDSAWGQYQNTIEGFGVAKASFGLAYSDYGMKYQKVFLATYGTGGAKAVSDEELKSFFQKNYSDFSYLAFPLYKTDDSGNFSAMLSADEKKKLEAEVNGYLTKIKAGSMTLQQAASAHKNVSVQAATPKVIRTTW